MTKHVNGGETRQLDCEFVPKRDECVLEAAAHHTKIKKKPARHSMKPFWCDNLTTLWKEFHNVEKSFVKCDTHDVMYKTLKERFLMSQRKFGKLLKNKKRSHERSNVYDLEQANVNNPNEF